VAVTNFTSRPRYLEKLWLIFSSTAGIFTGSWGGREVMWIKGIAAP
jgi:hypothetical protein